MKKVLAFLIVLIVLISCKTQNIAATEPSNSNVVKGDTIKIANTDLEYEVIIIDGGFTNWLNSKAFPRGYHSETYLESKNRMYVSEWNSRVMQPLLYGRNLYEMTINYDFNTHYGYEVNYLIYNYLIYFQNTYKQKLYGFVPPR